MLLQDMTTSKDKRLGKEIIKAMKESEQEWGWYHETKRMARDYGISVEEVENEKKSEWKKKIKAAIKRKLESKSEKKEQEMKKLRHQKDQKYERKEYLKSTSVNKSSKILRTRLEMMDIGNNHGKQRKCICGENESTEHIIECENTRKEGLELVKVEWLKEVRDVDTMERISEWMKRYMERRDENEKKQTKQ